MFYNILRYLVDIQARERDIKSGRGARLSQFGLAMWSLTITIVLLLTVTSSHGGLVRRSINDKPRPYTSGKDLLTMGGAGEAIRKSFEGFELEEMAKDLEKELVEISQVAAHINFTETEKMSEALALAKNIKSVGRFY